MKNSSPKLKFANLIQKGEFYKAKARSNGLDILTLLFDSYKIKEISLRAYTLNVNDLDDDEEFDEYISPEHRMDDVFFVNGRAVAKNLSHERMKRYYNAPPKGKALSSEEESEIAKVISSDVVQTFFYEEFGTNWEIRIRKERGKIIIAREDYDPSWEWAHLDDEEDEDETLIDDEEVE